MKSIRKAIFSGNWYPDSEKEVRAQLHKWEQKLGKAPKNIISGIVPHAGWFFSGIFAFDVIRRIISDVETIIVAGGHLPQVYPVLYYDEDFIETPCGEIEIDREFNYIISEKLEAEIDKSSDNTIEVQLPIIKALYGNVKIVPLRVPSGIDSLRIVDHIIQISEVLGRKTAFIGSTDLTHYGRTYGFIPEDSRLDPVNWVKESDMKILDSMVNMDSKRILKLADQDHSACSAGAAACAASYASARGAVKGQLLSYDTSFSKHEADSFVGYGAVIYKA